MFARYYRELLNFCARALQDRDAAADVVQETYARVLAAQKDGQAIHEPRALLHQSARNLIIDRHRRASLRDHAELDALAEADQPTAPAHQQPDEALASSQAIQAYIAAIENLPPRSREAFVLHIFDGLNHRQIAERMGISYSMVEKHIVRGRLACRQCEQQLNGVPAPEPKPEPTSKSAAKNA